MTASSTTTHTISGTSFTVGELRSFLRLFASVSDARPIRVQVHKGDRPNELDTFTLSITIPDERS
jgi:hypothetical protein